MSSLRLKTYFTRSFQHSVSILTNISAFFLQHLLKIRMIPCPAKHKQTKITQQQIHSHLKKVHVSRFPVVSNEAIQDLNSVAVNKHRKSFDLLNKTVNERTSSEASASPDPAILYSLISHISYISYLEICHTYDLASPVTSTIFFLL